MGYWLVILESPLWLCENPSPTCRRTVMMKALPWSSGPLELAQFPHGTSSGSNTAVSQKVNCSAGSTWWGRSRACCRPWLPLLSPASSLPPITFLSFSSVTQSCPTLCDPMDCSVPGFSAHHQLLEFAQTQIHRVHDAIQPSHPLSFPSPPAFSLSQHQGLFQ